MDKDSGVEMKSREADDTGGLDANPKKGRNQNLIPRFHLEKLSEL